MTFIATELKLADQSLAAQMFDWHQTVLAEEGRPSQAWINGVLEFTQKSLDLNPPSRRAGFRFQLRGKAAR